MKLPMNMQMPLIFKKGLSLVFWVLLLVLLAAELWVLTVSYRIIQQSQEVPTLTVTRQVRVNFAEYEKVIKKIEQGNVYVPAEESGRSPFGDE